MGTTFLGFIYLILCLAGFVLIVFLFWAPMKLYGIHKELVALNEGFRLYARRMKDSQDTQTRLLAAIANAATPVEKNGG